MKEGNCKFKRGKLQNETECIINGICKKENSDCPQYSEFNTTECPHCKFINRVFCGDHPIDSNRNYWQMTEVFVYLHDGKDSCNWSK